MRQINHYKYYLKTYPFILKRFPIAISRFYKAKWFQFKTRFQKQFDKKVKWAFKNKRKKRKTKTSFVNVLGGVIFRRKWYRVKQIFKNKLVLKRLLYIHYSGAIKLKYWHNVQKQSHKNRVDFLRSFLLQPYYKLDVLLWSLDFFDSSFSAKKALKNNWISLNSRFITGPVFLKKGDIVKVKTSINLKAQKDLYFSDKHFLPFCEIDYYTNEITIIKDFKELGSNDFPLIIKDYLRIRKWPTNL